jgi:hypothetical protein
MGSDGLQRTEAFVGLAIPKGPEQDWKQTPWGALISQAAAAGYTNGEVMAPTFSWKVTDGDSVVPNKKGKKPCEREGFPGHWVLGCATGLPIRCHHTGMYDPTQQIQDPKEIKRGDYCRIAIVAKANGSSADPSQNPGVYLNPKMFDLVRAGVAIATDSGPSAADVFGGTAAQLPAGAMVDAGVAAVAGAQNFNTPPLNPAVQTTQTPPPLNPAAQIQPHPQFLNPGGAVQPLQMSPQAIAQGITYESLVALGLDNAAMIAQGYALPTP